MIYRKFNGMDIPALGMGTMRLPMMPGTEISWVNGKDSENIDFAHTKKMVDYAMSKGVNYFDFGYDYHLGKADVAITEALKEYPRESYRLAHKFPGYNLKNMGRKEKIFERQIDRCQTEYFDFYLYHNVCELNIDAYLDEANGIHEYLMQQKADGRIKHLGLSTHGEYDALKRFLEIHGEDMEFCQIQLNYFDYKFQNADKKLELLAEYGIPVWVMEPMRGGRLAHLTEDQEARLKALRPDESIPSWAHRYLQSLPGVALVLTGASDFDQLADNISAYEEEKPLSDKEMEVINGIAEEMMQQEIIPCTACNYCAGHCPVEIEIPRMINLCNEQSFTGGGFIAPFIMQQVPEANRPDKCIACGSCVEVCPQKIDIPDVMKKLAKQMDDSPFV